MADGKLELPITVTEVAPGRFEASDGAHYWTDATPYLAVLGLTIFNAVDETLPYNDESAETEDARYDLWHTISKGCMNAIRGEEVSSSV